MAAKPVSPLLSAALPRWVALVAIGTVVDVIPHALMVLVSLGLRVTTGTREDAVVRRVCVTGSAQAVGTTVAGREPGVVKSGTRPSRRGVARLASGGESCSRVVRVRRILIVRLVTGVAVGGNRSVVVVHVAVGAGHCGMRARQRERRVVVIERGGNPRGRGVAQVALLRESDLHVLRVSRALKLFQMASNAGRAIQTVVSADVALRTLQGNMGAGQGKAGGCVVELAIHPKHRVMAAFASGGESSCHVVHGAESVVVVFLVA